MSILKLLPGSKDYIWGGRRLIDEYHKAGSGERLAETWELSCHKDGPCYIENGDYAGKTLAEYIEDKGISAIGTNAGRFEEFPVLIKFIDARHDLSIQVHPDDSYAMAHEGQYGKTEMWYVADCEPVACLYYGFSRQISRGEFAQRIKEQTLLEVLNRQPVKRGDVLFIEPGTIHAIGAGILIAEIQQNSNITYRVYDYGRRGADGKERDLHIEQALQITERVPILRQKSFQPHIVSCDYFTVDKVVLDGCRMNKMSGIINETSFVSLLVLEGEGIVRDDSDQLRFRKGDSLFIEAGSGEYEIKGCCEMLLTTVD